MITENTKFDKDLVPEIEIYSAYVYRIIITFLSKLRKLSKSEFL